MTVGEKKCVLIGIDSASPRLVERWQDSLPNLSQLIEKGSSGPLESTVPPLSAPAWTSMMTGKRPSKTGVFDWIRKPAGEDAEDTGIVTLKDVNELKLWDILGRNGLRSIVVNLPLTYPPLKLDGLMVSGIPGHIAGSGITYPNYLKAELDKATGGYEIYPNTDLRIKGNEKEYISDFERVLEKRTKAVLYLMEEKEWNFFMCVFFILDSVQHYFWKHMDQKHPNYDSENSNKWGDVIKQFYIKIDEKVGEIMDITDRDTDFLVVSDHGMGPLYGAFSINNFLREKGFLTTKRDLHIPSAGKIFDRIAKKFLRFGKKLPEPFVQIGKKSVPFEWIESLSVRGRTQREGNEILELIDKKRTKAFALGESGGIFLNENLAYDELSEELQKIKPPGTRNNVQVKIHKKRSYNEKFDTPDIFCTIDGYKMKTGLTEDGGIWSPVDLSGYHRKEGIFIGSGREFENNRHEFPLDIYDVLPTVLDIFDIDPPNDIDGKAVQRYSEIETK